MMKILYALSGKVAKGARRGRELGFPTANVPLAQLIPEGIYASRVLLHDKSYIAATFIGSAKTFGESDYKAEAYILDFDRNIYGETISIELLKKLRGNVKYVSSQKLIEQMKIDIEQTKDFFKNH